MAKKQNTENRDFFLRGISLTDLAVLNSVLHAQEKRNAELIAALEGAVQVVEEKCSAPELKNEAKKTIRSIRRLRIAQRSVPRLLKASMHASIEDHNPSIVLAETEQHSAGADDIEIAQYFFSTLKATVVQQPGRLVLWNDTDNSFLSSQDSRARVGGVVHICVNTPRNPRVLGFRIDIAVVDGKPSVTASALEFDHEYGNYFAVQPTPLTFARLKYRNETKET